MLRRVRLPAFRVAAIAILLLGTKPGGGYTASQPDDLLFWTRYEEGTALAPPTDCGGKQCWQSFTGTDNSTGHTWRPGVGVGRFQMLADAPVDTRTIGSYMANRIESGAGRSGSRALYSEIKRSGCCGTDAQVTGASQQPYLLEPKGADGDMYVSYWLKFQPNFEELMGRCGPNLGYHWRSVFEWKTAGDYRLTLVVLRDRDPENSCAFKGPLYWVSAGDNNANCNLFHAPAGKKCPPPETNLWSEKNHSVPVPLDQWFKVEVFWHRSSGKDGRAWTAVNGQVIADHRGPNTGDWNAPVDRVMTHLLYTSTAYPVFQWVDDLQIWRTFPTASSTDPWYDPPYAPH